MTELASQMTKEELRMLIDEALDQKFLEFFGDPDEGLELRESIKKRLIKQRQAVTQGDFGRPLDEVVKELGLD